MKIPYDLNPFGVEAGGKPYGPTNGLVFYAPLEEDGHEFTRGELSTSGSINFTTQNNLKTFVNTSSSYGTLYTDVQGKINDADIFSISFWMHRAFYDNAAQIFFEFGNTARSGKKAFFLQDRQGIRIGVVDGGTLTSLSSSYIPFQKWFHCVIIWDRTLGKITAYVDGQYINNWTQNYFKQFNFDFNGLAIGSNLVFTENWKNGYLCGLRLYNRELTQSEITELSQEYYPLYEISASDQTLSGFNPAQSYTGTISYTCKITPTFEIISGDTLPSSITFNTSNGKFTGKGLSDADHTYNLRVRMSGEHIVTKEINVTIKTSATTTLTVTSPQNISFITEKALSYNIQMTTQNETPTVTITSGELPTGITLSSYSLASTGTQTSNESSTVQIAVTTQYHPTPVYATLNIDVRKNFINVSSKTFKFYIDDGAASYPIQYTTQNPITPVFSTNDTLPNGFTLDTVNGTINYDGLYSAPTSKTVTIYVDSSTGCSVQGSGNYTVELLSGSMPAPSGYSFYAPLQDVNETEAETGQQILDKANMTGLLTAQTFKGVPCIHTSASSYEKRWWKYDQTGIAKQNEARTISIWVYLENSSANVIFAYGQTGSSPNYGAWLRLAPNSLDFAHFGFTFSNFTPQLNTWYNYVVTIDTTKHVSLYINGTLIQSGTISSSLSTSSTGGLYVFGNNWNDGWSAGYFSSLRIYNRVLTQDEITKLSQEFTPTE